MPIDDFATAVHGIAGEIRERAIAPGVDAAANRRCFAAPAAETIE